MTNRQAPRYRYYSGGAPSIRPSKIDYSQEGVDTRWIERIALLNEYVKHDDGADGRELCWIVHVEGEVCRRLEGHDERR